MCVVFETIKHLPHSSASTFYSVTSSSTLLLCGVCVSVWSLRRTRLLPADVFSHTGLVLQNVLETGHTHIHEPLYQLTDPQLPHHSPNPLTRMESLSDPFTFLLKTSFITSTFINTPFHTYTTCLMHVGDLWPLHTEGMKMSYDCSDLRLPTDQPWFTVI